MFRILPGAALTLILVASFSAIFAQEMRPANTSAPFEQLKSLAGIWEGTKGHDVPVTLTYEVVSSGSAVMERLQPGNEPEMITMYSLEGSRLVVTHYCSVGNQPTMQTEPIPAATSKYTFHFVRVSGTKTPDEGHMVSLVLSMPDKGHLTQVWTFEDHGKTQVETFSYTRKL